MKFKSLYESNGLPSYDEVKSALMQGLLGLIKQTKASHIYDITNPTIVDGFIAVYKETDFYLIKVSGKIETKSTSLADSTRNYLTTSARKVSYKKINKQYEVNTHADLQKALNKIKAVIK